MRLAVDTGLLKPGMSVFDYGCGHGYDLTVLGSLGYDADGWDPAHRPDSDRQPADVVNLGYVLNVISDPDDRAQAARRAWELAQTALVVSVRLNDEERTLSTAVSYGDGVLTGSGTFQKFFSQAEARDWLEGLLDQKVVAAAPGVFIVFRDETAETEWRSTNRARRVRSGIVKVSVRDALYDENRELLEHLQGFLANHGRPPLPDEEPWTGQVVDRFGSIPRAIQVIRHVTGDSAWEEAADLRRNELLIELALARLLRRPPYGKLPRPLQADIKALFGAYNAACERADRLLYAAGDLTKVRMGATMSDVGKRTSDALYVHIDAVPDLPPIMQVYEGCARHLAGTVPEANLVKLALDKSKVSYLIYPNFDHDPHPALAASWVVNLPDLSVSVRDYRDRDNPPILHRKDLLVPADYPRRDTFARLTAQEERHGLLDDATTIGTRNGWNTRLAETGWQLRGHRLVRA